MADKQVYERELADGSTVKYHVDHEKSEVYIETGAKHPVTGDVLLRFSSNNTLPFPKRVDEPVVAEEPAAFEDLFAPVTEEDAEPVVTGLEFHATPVDHLPDYAPEEAAFEPEHSDEE